MKKKVFMLFFSMLALSDIVQAQHHRDQLSFGIGPSFLYGNNTGYYSKLRIKLLPAYTLAYSYDHTRHWDFRASVGYQQFDGDGNTGNPSKKWIAENQAYDAKGQIYYMDLMPVYQFNPKNYLNKKQSISYYAGMGLGLMHVQREVKVAEIVPAVEGQRETWRPVIEDQQTTAIYFPVRIGLSTNWQKLWDLGLEGSALVASSNNLDGNTTNSKIIKPDVLFQFQVVLKRNISIN
ncbi:outer membrane beta-barrel protein [Anditalea andensis]|uniref:Outer membrane protein beta-barrel domain-containing protein n=1 Tax=Anditalea andensis TaxID=1048983 RepID=A0A074KSC7_9BACT|nr:outer membrane beta-barrel protein [Anditalea andensis]KEO71819.1 hypothetical protein EL17_21225 [Anditalea andensis]